MRKDKTTHEPYLFSPPNLFVHVRFSPLEPSGRQGRCSRDAVAQGPTHGGLEGCGGVGAAAQGVMGSGLEGRGGPGLCGGGPREGWRGTTATTLRPRTRQSWVRRFKVQPAKAMVAWASAAAQGPVTVPDWRQWRIPEPLRGMTCRSVHVEWTMVEEISFGM